MCGIWGLLADEATFSQVHEKEFMKIAARGPDLTVVVNAYPNVWLGFHRLSIVQEDGVPSEQPIIHNDIWLICNGELYNHEDLKAKSELDEVMNGASDCAALIHSFRRFKGDLRRTCASIDGVFAFLMVDSENLYIGRDPVGVRPLFYGSTTKGGLVFGSEMKCIERLCSRIQIFPPGCCATVPLKYSSPFLIDIKHYYSVPSIADRSMTFDLSQMLIQHALISAVRKRLMGNRRFGFMLSGGLDSSLIAAIASRHLDDQPPLAFSIGFEDSPDIESARIVASFLGIKHQVVIVTPEQCFCMIPKVIYALETFEPLLVRCGVVHYILCEYISRTSDVKVLLSGEGADELFGSYCYMQKAPSPMHLHREILRRMKLLNQYDVLRCDRATSCHGLEIRVPFLDKLFIDLVMRLPACDKLFPDKIEKYLLRSAFDGWLPKEVLWRGKEGFSEALGQIDFGELIQEHASSLISDSQFAIRSQLFPNQTPETKEEFWYRALFESFFDYRKVAATIHTKVYRTAAWQTSDKKENVFLLAPVVAVGRLRRRSTGSSLEDNAA
ncbi:hypothetical protein AB6A40_003275 [Gnathostoma spinigerum]|uniref:Asparagine synthetase [glutamine-hydrolyzing] n=1 Tax=Gnathostoma spinigerum TaxID=75299 RepID=A0ABD6EAC3_9BILA